MKNHYLYVATLLSLLGVVAALHAAPGDLDKSFGGTGAIQIGFGGGDDRGNAVAIQTDDKVIVAGYAPEEFDHQFILIRYDVDGSLDHTFGVGGKVLTTFGVDGADANAVAVQGDGKIIAAGGSGNDFAVARYNLDGSLDSFFGVGGRLTTDFGGTDYANAAAMQPDGKILVAGKSNSDIAVARYNTDGSLDTSFSGDGKLTTAGTNLGADAIAVQGSGKIFVAGRSTTNGTGVRIVRYNSDGSLDTAFGGTGIVLAVTGSFGSRVALGIQTSISQADKIVAATGGFLIRYLTDGSPDTTFGGDGIVAAGANNTGIAFQTTAGTANRILVCGAAANPSGGSIDFTLSRYFLSGLPDTAFGNSGVVYTPLGAFADYSQAIRIRSSKLVVVGHSTSTESGSDADVSIARYTLADGSLDTSFDGDGKRVDDLGDIPARAKGVMPQPDGKIVVAGNTFFSTDGRDFGIARFLPDGSFDSSFGRNGKVITDINGSDEVGGLALQTDGKIVVAGGSGDENAFALVRYDASGALDSTFNGGIVTTVVGASSQATAVAIQVDGKIVAAGRTRAAVSGQSDFAVVRYLSNGMLDTGFGSGGQVVTGIGAGEDQPGAMALQPDGKIVVAGYAGVGGNSANFAAVRFNANGTLDSSFGSFGMVTTNFPGDLAAIGYGMALQPDGKIVVAGATVPPSQIYEVALVRYLANGTLDTSFDGDGRVRTAIGVASDIANAVAIQGDGKIVAAGLSYFGGSTVFNAVRYQVGGSLDGSFGTGGKVLVDPSAGADTAYALTIDSSGRTIIAGEAGGLVGVVRLQGDGGVAPTALSAVSRKVHGGAGTFDINLPLTGTPGLESRSGASHQVVVAFAGPVNMSGFTVSGGASPGSFSVNGSEATLNVMPDAVPAGKRLIITMQNVTGGSANGNVVIPLNLLVGDTNANGSVNGADVGQTKSQSGQTVTASNFRADVNAGGTINAADVGQVKAASGTTLPPQ